MEFEVDIFLTGRKQIWKLNVKDRRKLQKLSFVIRCPLGTENSKFCKKNRDKISYLKFVANVYRGCYTKGVHLWKDIRSLYTHSVALSLKP